MVVGGGGLGGGSRCAGGGGQEREGETVKKWCVYVRALSQQGEEMKAVQPPPVKQAVNSGLLWSPFTTPSTPTPTPLPCPHLPTLTNPLPILSLPPPHSPVAGHTWALTCGSGKVSRWAGLWNHCVIVWRPWQCCGDLVFYLAVSSGW